MLNGSNTWCRPEIFYWHCDWSKIYAQKSMPTLTSNAWAKIFLVLTRPSLNSFSTFSVDGDAGKCKRNDALCANVVIIIIRLSKPHLLRRFFHSLERNSHFCVILSSRERMFSINIVAHFWVWYCLETAIF